MSNVRRRKNQRCNAKLGCRQSSLKLDRTTTEPIAAGTPSRKLDRSNPLENELKNTVKFELRPSSAGPVFVGSYAPGDTVDIWEPEVGNTVTTHVGQVAILARITTVDARKYGAEIMGFEKHDDYEFQGMKPGDGIEFSYEYIFSCSR